ncbi:MULTISPECIES: flagellar biosynthetic protein FliO [unclassified Paenibacillus]|uniref:flagellar biosynthetic protein FliO n=1 Tax=unclassified Paenibacillus TaxID=185978 RepID=UPI002F426040
MVAKLGSVGLWLAASSETSGLPEEPTFKQTSPGELLGSIVWIMVALGIVIVLIVLLLKWMSNRNKLWGVNRALRSLGGTSLGQHSSLQVIEVAGRIYIVGVGQNITLLDKIDDPLEAQEVLAAFERDADQGWSSGQFGLAFIKKWQTSKAAKQQEADSSTANSDSSFEDLLQNQLNQRTMRNEQLKQLIKDAKSNERLMDDEK